MTSTRLPLLSDSAACFAWSRHTTTVKNDEERRLLLPPTRHRHPEHGPGDPGLGVPQLRVVGEVAGKAHAGLGHAASRAVCPALGPGGRWTPRHAERAPGASDRANEVGHGSGCRAWSAQVPGWLVECLRLGVGHASTVRPDPSTRGVVGERGSHHEGRWPARFRLVPEVESALSGYGFAHRELSFGAIFGPFSGASLSALSGARSNL
jgi:hypothetical protein